MTDRTTDDILATYCAAWGEPAADKRRALLESCWAEDGIYCDPNGAAHGRAALSEMIAKVHGQIPGGRIVLTSGIDQHHAALRFEWALLLPDDTVVVPGIDFATLAEDGRLASVTGFFGPIPAK